MNKLLALAKSKTVWGSLLLAASFAPQLAPYAGTLHVVGTGLAGVGVADKLDKIKAALTNAPTP